MFFFETQTTLALAIASLPACVGLYLFLVKNQQKAGMLLLLATALLLRLVMISLDPFLHEWDERYHALVAKNLIDTPFRPVLFPRHIIAYDISDWSYNHVWLNKQPVFLWQMALSMKLFGVNLLALRLPSAIMGTVLVWMTYDSGKRWTQDPRIGFVAALFVTFGRYNLELISGRYSLDHNDVAFAFYITASCWAFTRFVQSTGKLKWSLLTGLFAGLAILNKWLTGLLIFGGWGIYYLLSNRSDKRTMIKYGFVALLVCACTFIPWQLYIASRFPMETASMHAFNKLHFTDPLGHPGSVFFHIAYMDFMYHPVLKYGMLIGMIVMLARSANRKLTLSFTAMIVAMFVFFSVFVATKMGSYVYPVVALLSIFGSAGLIWIADTVAGKMRLRNVAHHLLLTLAVCGCTWLTFRPAEMIAYRSDKHITRNTWINNAQVYERVEQMVPPGVVVLNCRSYQNISLMFHSDVLAYHYYPAAEMLDSLQEAGHRFAAFDYPCDHQELPTYMMNDTAILILPESAQ